MVEAEPLFVGRGESVEGEEKDIEKKRVIYFRIHIFRIVLIENENNLDVHVSIWDHISKKLSFLYFTFAVI